MLHAGAPVESAAPLWIMLANRAAPVVAGMQQALCFSYAGVNLGVKNMLVIGLFHHESSRVVG